MKKFLKRARIDDASSKEIDSSNGWSAYENQNSLMIQDRKQSLTGIPVNQWHTSINSFSRMEETEWQNDLFDLPWR